MDEMTATVRNLTIGTGTAYEFLEVPTGILDDAPIRELDEPRPRRDGVIAGGDFLGPRRPTFEIRVVDTVAVVETRLKALVAAFARARTEEELMVRLAGDEHAFFGRCRGTTVFARKPFPDGRTVAVARCTFVATDPLKYGTADVEVIGLDEHLLPQTLPFILGLHDSATVVNSGEAEVDRWSCEIEAVNGICENPGIAHADTGRLVFHGLTLDDGDTLVVNGHERRALLNGDTPVVPEIAQWWSLTPGANTIRFSASIASSLDCTATLTHRPGWT